jgi:hypothetical protein
LKYYIINVERRTINMGMTPEEISAANAAKELKEAEAITAEVIARSTETKTSEED